jgi:hypothetical protein
MADYTNWKRVDLESPGQSSLTEVDLARRRQCEEETNRDLNKSIQQLICDVHEEASDPSRPLELSQVTCYASNGLDDGEGRVRARAEQRRPYSNDSMAGRSHCCHCVSHTSSAVSLIYATYPMRR